MWEKEFSKLGLNENEREVYLSVLKAGKIAPFRVARETGINRTTVYSIARKLAKLGLITEDLAGKGAYLCAEKPEALEEVYRREEEQIADKKRVAQKLAQELKNLSLGDKYSVPRIRFVEEEDLNDYLYKQFPRWMESAEQHDATWWGYHDHSFTEHYGDWIKWSWKMGPRDQKVRFFVNAVDVEKMMSKKHPARLIKPLSAKETFDSSLWVVGDYVLMTRSREKPHYLVEIHDSALARSQRQLFKNLWEK